MQVLRWDGCLYSTANGAVQEKPKSCGPDSADSALPRKLIGKRHQHKKAGNCAAPQHHDRFSQLRTLSALQRVGRPDNEKRARHRKRVTNPTRTLYIDPSKELERWV